MKPNQMEKTDSNKNNTNESAKKKNEAEPNGKNGQQQKQHQRVSEKLLRMVWAVWNLFLAVFSFYGASRVVPVLLKKVYADGFRHVVCTLDERDFYFGDYGMALGLFCLSKGPELVDTVFLLLSGKKNLPFLQWFHHVTTFLYCWHAYAVGSSALPFAAALNYSVHTAMYSYFFLAEVGFKHLVKPFGVYITMMQILQMLIGTALISMVVVYKVDDWKVNRTPGSDGRCDGVSWSVARVQLFIAVTNLILFSDMFLKAYVFKKKKVSGPNTAATTNGKKHKN